MPKLELQLVEIPVVPDEEIHFDVEVDRQRCANMPLEIEAELERLERDGLRIGLNMLIGLCAAHYENSPVPLALVERTNQPEQWHLTKTWVILTGCNPHTEAHPVTGRPKLIVDINNNPRDQAQVVEILPVGIGLQIAMNVYKRERIYWHSSGLERQDFRAPKPDGTGEYKLEVRGRFRRNNWKAAKEDIYKKFADGDFANAMGVIYAPTDTPNTREPEITIMDPVGTVAQKPISSLRAILLHYIPFFEAQGLHEAVERLKELAYAEDGLFEHYLACGDDALRQLGKHKRLSRTRFQFGGAVFKGTAWDGHAWPRAVTNIEPPTEGGCFYWALWDKVLEALQEGNLSDIAEMAVKAQTSRIGNMVFMLQEDATAFAWAPTEAELNPSAFEDQLATATASYCDGALIIGNGNQWQIEV